MKNLDFEITSKELYISDFIELVDKGILELDLSKASAYESRTQLIEAIILRKYDVKLDLPRIAAVYKEDTVFSIESSSLYFLCGEEILAVIYQFCKGRFQLSGASKYNRRRFGRLPTDVKYFILNKIISIEIVKSESMNISDICKAMDIKPPLTFLEQLQYQNNLLSEVTTA